MAAVANSHIRPQSWRTENAVCTAAKTTYSNSTNAVKLLDADADGSWVTDLYAMPRDTVTANQLQVYRSPDDGTTMYLVDSALMGAYTMAQTTAVPVTELTKATEAEPLKLDNGESLWVGVGVALAAGIVFTAKVGDL